MEVEKKMIDQETMNWINKLTTTDREFIIKTLKKWTNKIIDKEI